MTTDILGPCNHVIGTRYVESIKPYLLELTGLRIAVGPHDVATLDLRTDRIMIYVDADNCIKQLQIA